MKTIVKKSRSRLLRNVLTILENDLGRRRRRRRPEPLETLLHAVLSDVGNDIFAARVLADVEEQLVDWNELRVSTPRGIEEMISAVPDAAEKALTIKRILQKLFLERHCLNLNHFNRYGQPRIWSELGRFGGLSQAVKARVLLKAFDFNVLPLTSEIERVSKRIGIVDNYLTTEKAAEAFEEILPPKRTYSFYHLLSEHAETVCTARNYDCGECVLSGICARGKNVLKK